MSAATARGVPTAALDPVCVTGVGLVAAQGTGGRDAVRVLRERLLGTPAAPAAGDLALEGVDLAALVGGKGLRHMSRGTLALLAATRLALADAGLADAAARDADSTGVAAGTATATAGLVADFDRTTLVEGPQSANPALFPQTVWNGAACQAAIRHGLRGPNVTVSSGLSSGLCAVLAAAQLLRRGRARAVLAAGFEEITPYFRVLFEPGAGDAMPRLSEGAVVLVLETRAAAAARGVQPLATIGDGRSAFSPHPADAAVRLRSLIGEVLAASTPAAGPPTRSWCLGRGASATVAPAAAIDLYAAAGCGGGLSGALAVALAAAGDGATELVAAADDDSQVAALLVEPAA